MKANNFLLLLVVILVALSLFWYFDNQASSKPGIPDLVTIDYPREGAVITSPLTVRGEARGTWFFEASAPMVLTDGDGLIIAESHVQAQGEWMTENFVPFEGKLTFTKPANAAAFGNRGTLILKNDNPSGDPSRDKAVEIPVSFK